MTPFNVLLFDDFETLDAFGPVELVGKMQDTYQLGYFSLEGGTVLSSQKLSVNTLPFSQMDTGGVLLIPGGQGTRQLVLESDFIEQIKMLSTQASYVLTVCTGSALLAKTGLLRGIRATSNKRSFDWVCENGPGVNWVRKARWTNDGKYYTSSGVSAGMDMILGFFCDIHGEQAAQDLSKRIEYIWNSDKDNDPFAK